MSSNCYYRYTDKVWMNQKRLQCKEAISIAKHLGTRNTRLPKEEIEPRTCHRNWVVLHQKTNSRELAAHAIKANKQTVRKKNTKGWGSGKCIATNMHQSRVATTKKQMQFNFYDKFGSQKHVPEYVCTCCDQLRFKCSVVKCDPNKYKACSPDIVESCLTNCRWHWMDLHNLQFKSKKGRLPSCSKAKKMGFPYDPEVLNLMSLEEFLISPRIPFMQIRNLPRGGQLSIQGTLSMCQVMQIQLFIVSQGY